MDNSYGYQKIAANVISSKMFSKGHIATVLAACPGAGKNTISHLVISKYLNNFPNARVLVLTEGQNILKEQYLEELDEPNVDIDFEYGDFSSNAQVRVGIPQSISKLDWDYIDLLIIDEAHNFYTAKTVQDIINKLNPTNQMLMTGSPTRYNKHNKETYGKKFFIHYISADELKVKGIFSGVELDVARITWKKNSQQTIAEVMKHAREKGKDLSKIMVACPSIAYAKRVADYLKDIGRKVSISTSENDADNYQIKRFKRNETDTLVVVDKGILGFNDKNITYLIDLKSSLGNVDTNYQLFARVLRTHPEDVFKGYCRVGHTSGDFNKQVIMLHKMKALMRSSVYENFTGKNLKVRVG